MTQVSAKVAVIGCGLWGQNLVRNFSEIGCLGGVFDVSTSAANAMSATYGTRTLGPDELLDRSDIDAVAIASPPASHAEWALRALAAGKHVLVEKPLALKGSDGAAVCAAADAAGLTLMVGHLLRYHPAFERLQDLVHEGAIGQLQYLYSNRLNLGRIRREEDILWSFAPHDLSMILSLVGSDPTWVSAAGASYINESVGDVTITHLGFERGIRAHVFVSWLHPFKEQKLVVIGDAGMVVFDDGEPWDSKLRLYEHRIDLEADVPRTVRADARKIPVTAAEPLALECRHFVDCIETGTHPRTDGWEGLRVLEVLERASESLQVPTNPAVADKPYFVHESSFVDEGSVVGAGTKIWHFSHVLPQTRIGDRCSLGQNVVVGPRVTIGDDCRIQNNVSVYEGVTLEDGVFCGPSCVFTNVQRPRAEVDRRAEFIPTHVKRGASIGANATIVCGNEIGEYAMIGAGAVVTCDVPAHALMVGVPARRVGWVSHEGEVLGDDLVCARTGRKYVEVAAGRLRAVED